MTNWTRTVGTVLMIVIAALASSLDVSANTGCARRKTQPASFIFPSRW